MSTVALAGPLDFWSISLAVTNANWNGGIFANGRFVVSLDNGQGATGAATLVSEDGLTWRRTREETIRQLTAGNGLIIGTVGTGDGTGAGLAVVSSGDGENWITRRPPFRGSVVSLSYGLGKFWIHGYETERPGEEHVMLASADGMNWEVATTNSWAQFVGPENQKEQRQVVFCHDRFLTQFSNNHTTTTGEVLQSFDGTHFAPAPGWPAFTSIAHLNGNWVLANKTNTSTISVSTNGEAWTTFSPSPFWRNGQIRSNGQRLFSHSGQNFFFESVDGVKWVDHQVDLPTRFSLSLPLVSGANKALVLSRYTLPPVGTKPQPNTNVARVYFSQPFAPVTPATLAATQQPALTLEAGTVGSGYQVEAADNLSGPWTPVATLFPTNFPFSFLAPEAGRHFRFFRAVGR
jgi:hypothetical protein